MDHFSRIHRAVARLSVLATTSLALAAPASAQESFKLGIVTFLSGPGADSFGVPARNGGQFVIDQLNKGAAPAPYDKVGFGGMKVEPVIIDENGGATKQVQDCAISMGATRSMSCSAISAQATVSRWRRSPRN
jgi:branched-chain amino acid transport system substrate-binding protein